MSRSVLRTEVDKDGTKKSTELDIHFKTIVLDYTTVTVTIWCN